MKTLKQLEEETLKEEIENIEKQIRDSIRKERKDTYILRNISEQAKKILKDNNFTVRETPPPPEGVIVYNHYKYVISWS